ETRSAPGLTRCYPHSFTFCLGNPFPRFVVNELGRPSNEGTLRAPRNADRFATFKIFRRPGALRRRVTPGQSRSTRPSIVFQSQGRAGKGNRVVSTTRPHFL